MRTGGPARRTALAAMVLCGTLGLCLHAPVKGSVVAALAGRAAAPAMRTVGMMRSARKGCTSAWRIVPSPNTGTSTLAAVAPVSARDVWAVGSVGMGLISRPLAEHWDGRQWRIVPVALPSVLPASIIPATSPYATGTGFNAVAAVSAHNVWAVGLVATGATTTRPLAEHWDGRRWQIVETPRLAATGAFNAVAAVSAHDVWAVGTVHGAGTLAEHWDGHTWRIVPMPRLRGQDVELAGVAALSTSEVWAVGGWGSAADGARQGLVERWDRRRWRVVPSPQPGQVDNVFTAISASSPRDMWAVGSAEGSDYQTVPLAEHWAGTAWRVVPRPQLPQGQDTNGLSTVAASGHGDAWVAGGSALAMWTGHRWATTTIPFKPSDADPPGTEPRVLALAAVSPADVWAVGQIVVNTDLQYVTVIAHYSAADTRLRCS